MTTRATSTATTPAKPAKTAAVAKSGIEPFAG